MTPLLLPWTIANSYLATGWVFGDASVRTDVQVHFAGGRTVRRTERLATDTPGTALGADIAMPALLLLVNPFERVRLDSLEVRIEIEKRNTQARVTKVRATPVRAEVGDDLRVEVRIEPYRGEPETRTIELTIPGSWAGRKVRLLAGSTNDFVQWDQDRAPEKFVPHSLAQLVDMVGRVPDDATLTFRAYSDEQGTLLQGVEIPALPPSLSAASATGGSKGGIQPISGSLLEERRIETPWVLSGGEVVEIEVAR
jgi:hypothetical protein